METLLLPLWTIITHPKNLIPIILGVVGAILIGTMVWLGIQHHHDAEVHKKDQALNASLQMAVSQRDDVIKTMQADAANYRARVAAMNDELSVLTQHMDASQKEKVSTISKLIVSPPKVNPSDPNSAIDTAAMEKSVNAAMDDFFTDLSNSTRTTN